MILVAAVLALVATVALVVLIVWAVRLFRANIETSRIMAASDREQSKLVLDLFGRLQAGLEKLDATALRIEEAARVVAADLVVAQSAVDGVASDLADGHTRADETTGPPGAAADAAMQSGSSPS